MEVVVDDLSREMIWHFIPIVHIITTIIILINMPLVESKRDPSLEE